MAGPTDASDRAKPPGVKGGGTVRLGPPAPNRQQRRKALLETTVDAVHSGKFDEGTGARILRKAGFPDSKNPFVAETGGLSKVARGVLPYVGVNPESAVGKVVGMTQPTPEKVTVGGVTVNKTQHGAGVVAPGTGLISQLVGPLAAAAVNTPGGGVGFVEQPIGTPQRIAEHLSHPNLVEDVLLGYLALHGGASAGLRAKAAKQAYKSPRPLPTPAPSPEGGMVTRMTLPTAFVTKFVSHGYVEPDRVTRLTKSMLDDGYDATIPPVDIYVGTNGKVIMEGNHRPLAANAAGVKQIPANVHFLDSPVVERTAVTPSRSDLAMLRGTQGRLRAATTRSAQEGGSLLHTPRAQPVPITIQGQRLEGPATAAGVLPRLPGVTFERPVVQNPLVRPFSRARSKRIEAALNREGPERPLGVPVGRGKRIPGSIATSYDVGAPPVSLPHKWTQEPLHRVNYGDASDGFYYHVTTVPAAKKIIREGLKPGKPATMDEGFYRTYSQGKVFLSERGTAKYWADRIEEHLDSQFDNPPKLTIIKIPKSDVPNVKVDELGAKDSHAPSYYIDAPAKPVAGETAVGPRPATVTRTETLSSRAAARRIGKRTDARVRGTFSAANTAGRELRAHARVRSEIENAHGAALHRFTRGLSPAERDAMTVVAISGDHAFADPAGAVAQQVAAHAHWTALGGDPIRNAEHIASIQAAEKVLRDPSEKFLRALALAQDVSRGTEASLIRAGLLEPGTAAGRQAKIADLYGYDTPPEGSFYFPLAERYQNTGITPAGAFETRPSQFGAGPPAMGTRIPGINQTFTGESVASGRLPNVGEALAKRATQVNNALAVRRQYDELWRIGRPEKRSEFDIPVRDTSAIQGDLRKFMSDLSQTDLPLDADAVETLIQGQLVDLATLLEGGLKTAYGGRPVGAASRIDGVRWVDSRLVSPSAPSVKGNVFKAADAITNPIRFTQLYARPAYILNLAGNLGMNGISEGARVFPALKWAATAQKRLPGDVMREIDGGVGVSLSRIYSIGRGPLGELNDRAAEMWNRITDMHSRRAAFKAEADREGFITDAEVIDLMTNPAHEAARTRVFRQANKNIVDYSSLTPFERDEVRRLIYFYPWVSRGTIWTLRTMIEHPYKTFTMFELGQIGAENANKKLGQHQPKWIAETGLVPVGSSHKGLQKVINPSSLWTPTTAVQAFSAAADTAEAALGLPHTASGAGDLLTPAASLFTQASTRYEGGANATGLRGLAESIPYYQAGRRAGLYGAPSKTYPVRGVDQAAGPLLIGGLFPRPLSLEQAGRQAVNQARSPRAKLAIQIDQAAELGLITADQAETYRRQLPDVPGDKVASARRRIGAALKAAYAEAGK